MITDVDITAESELVYSLESIGLEGELIITPEKNAYIITDTDYFSVRKESGRIIIENDEDSFDIDEKKLSLIEDALKEIG